MAIYSEEEDPNVTQWEQENRRSKEVANIIDFARLVGRESEIQVEKYMKWEAHILPLIEQEFNIKRFSLNLRSIAKKEIQDFINKKEIEYLAELK